jgi:hypothetical protein
MLAQMVAALQVIGAELRRQPMVDGVAGIIVQQRMAVEERKEWEQRKQEGLGIEANYRAAAAAAVVVAGRPRAVARYDAIRCIRYDDTGQRTSLTLCSVAHATPPLTARTAADLSLPP